MTTTDRSPLIHDLHRGPPLPVRTATTAWFLAVGAGVAESVLGVIGALADGSSVPGLVAQVAFRAVVYGGLFVVIDRYFRRGVPWSRWLLGGLLGLVGLATLIAGPISWLVTEGDFSSLAVDASWILFAVLRTVHVLAVLAGVVLMFRPESNRWFRTRRN